MNKSDIHWFAAGGGLSRSGPYATDWEAWEAMEYTEEIFMKSGLRHPADTRVWPERKER